MRFLKNKHWFQSFWYFYINETWDQKVLRNYQINSKLLVTFYLKELTPQKCSTTQCRIIGTLGILCILSPSWLNVRNAVWAVKPDKLFTRTGSWNEHPIKTERRVILSWETEGACNYRYTVIGQCTDLFPMYRGVSSFSQVTVSFSVESCFIRQSNRTMEPLFTIRSSGPLTILVGSAKNHKMSLVGI